MDIATLLQAADRPPSATPLDAAPMAGEPPLRRHPNGMGPPPLHRRPRPPRLLLPRRKLDQRLRVPRRTIPTRADGLGPLGTDSSCHPEVLRRIWLLFR